MKKTIKCILILILGVAILFSNGFVLAADPGNKSESKCGDNQIQVKVLTELPGMGCTTSGSGTGKTVTCCVSKKFHRIGDIIGPIIKRITYFSGIIGIMMVVAYGILYSMSGVSWLGGESGFNKIKGRFVTGMIGILLLFFSGLILKFLAPWIYT